MEAGAEATGAVEALAAATAVATGAAEALAVATVGVAATMEGAITEAVATEEAITAADAMGGEGVGTVAVMEDTAVLVYILHSLGIMGRRTIIIPIICPPPSLRPPRHRFTSNKAGHRKLHQAQVGDIAKIRRAIILISKNAPLAGSRSCRSPRAWNPTIGITVIIPEATTLMSGNVRQDGNRFSLSRNPKIKEGPKSMLKKLSIFSLTGLVLFGGCAMTPTGPSVLVLPGTGKPYEQFRSDDYYCRQMALMQTGGVTPQMAAAQSGLASAAVGTAIGAATGAAVGGGQGAAVGAGVGLAGGSMVGVGMAESTGSDTQQRYDYGYLQCMYAKGHKIPVWGKFTDQAGGAATQQTPTPAQQMPSLPPPPPNQPPPNGPY